MALLARMSWIVGHWDSYKHPWIWSSLKHEFVCRLFGASSWPGYLSELLSFGSFRRNSRDILRLLLVFISEKCNWTCRLQTGNHFTEASMCYRSPITANPLSSRCIDSHLRAMTEDGNLLAMVIFHISYIEHNVGPPVFTKATNGLSHRDCL